MKDDYGNEIKQVRASQIGKALGKLDAGDTIQISNKDGLVIATYEVIKPDPRNEVLEIIRDLERERNEPAERSKVLIAAAGAQLEYEDVIAALEKLKADGMIYDPNRDGRYVTV